MNIVLFGPPGIGKGTIAARVSEKFSIPHISTGDIFRDHIKRNTDLGKQIKNILESGDLIPDELTTNLVSLRLSEQDTTEGYILDGYPRTPPQAQWLNTSHKITHYIIFEAPTSVLIKRLSGRRVHAQSGRTYHTIYNPPRIEDKDDVTGELLTQREDDKPKKITKRLSVYEEQTALLLSFIKKMPQHATIDATKSIDIVLETVLTILK